MLENELGARNRHEHRSRRRAQASEILARLAKDTEHLALFEHDNFSSVPKRSHPFPGATAAATLHSCFGVVLKQYLAKAPCLTDEFVHRAGLCQAAGIRCLTNVN
jgi:hypothetical protein